MRIKFVLALCCLIFTSCAGSSVNNTVNSAVKGNVSSEVFPSITVYDLNNQKHEFPQEFKAHDSSIHLQTLVLIAFKREQQKDLDPWIKELVSWEKELKFLRVIEMPVIENSTAAFRTFVNNGMRSGISDEAARNRTMTLYVNKSEFLTHLKISDEMQVYVLVVNNEGMITKVMPGNYTPEKAAEIKALLSL